MTDLLNVLHLSDHQMNNKTLRAWLKMVNPSRSYLTADELRNFRIWGVQIRKRENLDANDPAGLITDAVLKLKEMFSDMIEKPGCSIAAEESNSIFLKLLQDAMED